MGSDSNNTTVGDAFKCLAKNAPEIIFVFCSLLFLSLLLNILCCVLRFCPVKKRRQRRKKPRQSARQMEENPIYGNVSYTEPFGVAVYTEATSLHPSIISSSPRNPQRVNPDSQLKSQDCYANLTLKIPRPLSGHSSPQILEVASLEEPPGAERGDDGDTDAVSTMSDLYASVQNQRSKTIDTLDSAEEYANHL